MSTNRIKKFFERGSDPFTTGDLSTGGLMPIEVLKAFVQSMRDRSAALRAVRVEIMKSATKALDRIDLPERTLYNPDEGVGAGSNLFKPTTGRRTLTAKKASMAMDWAAETIEDSIEGGDLESTLLSMTSKNYANQTVDLGFNGDEASQTPFLAMNDGWLKIAKSLVGGGGAARHDTTASTDWKAIFSAMIALVPAKYKDSGMAEEGWEFWCDPTTEQGFRDQLAARQTALGDQAASEGRRSQWQGIPVVPRGYFPAKTILLTPPKNLAYGIRREPKINLWYDNDKDRVQARVHGRIDYEVVEPELIVLGYDV